MRQGGDQSNGKFHHTASQLAEMGYCERKMLLRLRYGAKTSLSRLAAQEHGTREHARFLAEARKQEPGVSSAPPMTAFSAPATIVDRIQRLLTSIISLIGLFEERKR